jgi:hypothetical protein
MSDDERQLVQALFDDFYRARQYVISETGSAEGQRQHHAESVGRAAALGVECPELEDYYREDYYE